MADLAKMNPGERAQAEADAMEKELGLARGEDVANGSEGEERAEIAEQETSAAADTPPETPPAEPVETKAEAVQPDYEKLQHAHDVLKGKYNAETARFREQLKDAQARLDAAERARREDEARAKPAETSVEPDEAPEEAREWLNDKGFQTAAEILLQKKLKAVEDKLRKEFEERQVQSEADSRHLRYLTELRSEIPNYQQANEDERFQEHLASTVDPLSGRTLAELLLDADREQNVPRLKAIMHTFYGQQPASSQPRPNRPSLESQVSPAKPASSGRSEAPSKQARIYNESEWQAEAQITTRQMIAHPERSEELQRKMDELEMALRENRVRTG